MRVSAVTAVGVYIIMIKSDLPHELDFELNPFDNKTSNDLYFPELEGDSALLEGVSVVSRFGGFGCQTALFHRPSQLVYSTSSFRQIANPSSIELFPRTLNGLTNVRVDRRQKFLEMASVVPQNSSAPPHYHGKQSQTCESQPGSVQCTYSR